MKFDTQQFDGHINVGMWKVHTIVVLAQGIEVALSSKEMKLNTLMVPEWEDID